MNRLLKWLAVASAAGMYIVLLQGSLVTNTGSRYGCGRSWPLCHGKFIPAYALETLIEFSHRAVTGIVGLLVVALAVSAWRALRREHPAVRLLAPAAVFFLVLQSALGALVVLWPQPKTVLALHFGISLLDFGSVLLLAVIAFQAGRPGGARPAAPVSGRLRRWIWIVTAYLMAVVYSGAFVRHTSSDLACVDWPLCNGQVLPPLTGPVGIQFAHRLAAATAVVLVARLFFLARLERGQRPELYAGAAGALALILAQAGAGALVVLTQLSLAAKMLHSTLIIALFGVLSYLCLQAAGTRRAPAARVHA